MSQLDFDQGLLEPMGTKPKAKTVDPLPEEFNFGGLTDPIEEVPPTEDEITEVEELDDLGEDQEIDPSETPDDDSQEDIPTGQDSEESDEDDEGEINYHYFHAKRLQEEGRLPEDFEIGEDITYDDIREAYNSKLTHDAPVEAKETLVEELKTLGYNEEDILFARAYRNGADPRQFSQVEIARQYGAADVSKLTAEQKHDMAKSMYLMRGMEPEEADALIQASDLDAQVEKSKKFHGQQYEQWEQAQQQQEQQREEAARQQRAHVNQTINRVLSTKEAKGMKFTKEMSDKLKRGLYEADETLEIQGNVHRVTAINKFLYEFQTDLELQMKLFLQHTNAEEFKAAAKSAAQEELEKEMRKGGQGRPLKTKSTNRKPARALENDPSIIARIGFSS